MHDFASLPPQHEAPSLAAQQDAISLPSAIFWPLRMHAACPSLESDAILSQHAHFALSADAAADGSFWVAVWAQDIDARAKMSATILSFIGLYLQPRLAALEIVVCDLNHNGR